MIQFLLSTLLFLMLSHASIAEEPSSTQQSIDWQPYAESVFTEAAQKRHLVLVFVKATWCKWCKEMDATTLSDPSIIKAINQQFLPVKVDLNENADFVAKYQITDLPTILIFDSNRKLVKLVSGYLGPDALLQVFAEVKKHKLPIEENMMRTDTVAAQSSLDGIVLPEKKQKWIYEKLMLDYANNASDVDKANKDNIHISEFKAEYAVELAHRGNKVALSWLNNTLTNGLNLLDVVWGGMYPYSRQGDWVHPVRTKPLATQAANIDLYVKAYLLTENNQYLFAAERTSHFIMTFLTSPEGAFYAGQAAKMQGDKQDDTYYTLNDVMRREAGVPVVYKEIYANSNGMAINALAFMFVASGDVVYKKAAIKAFDWINAHLLLPGGGYKHSTDQNNELYLSDTLAMGRSALVLYKITNQEAYLQHAIDALNFIQDHFQNPDKAGGFVTLTSEAGLKNKRVEVDPKENALLARFAALIYHYTGEKRYFEVSKTALKYLTNPDVMKQLDPATILVANDAVVTQPLKMTIIGPKSDPAAFRLYHTALRFPTFYMQIGWYDDATTATKRTRIDYPELKKAAAFFCYQGSCSLPVYTSDELGDIAKKIIADTKQPSKANVTSSLTSLLPTYSVMWFQKIFTDTMIERNWSLLGLGFWLIGLLLAFTPCVFPFLMVLMTLLLSEAGNITRLKMFLLALTYVLSLSITYATLGYLVSILGVHMQIHMQSNVVILAMSIFLGILSLSLLGAYKIKLPDTAQHYLIRFNSFHWGTTYIGAAIMGVTLTLIASPCAAAPLIGVLTIITQISDPILGIFALFMMGIGIGTPLLVAGIFGTEFFPKTTKWQHNLETVFGLFVMAIAIWLASRAVSGMVYMLLASAFAILTSLYMGLFRRLHKGTSAKVWKSLSIMTVIYGIAIMVGALSGNTNPFSPLVYKRGSVSEYELSKMGIFESVTSEAILTKKIKLAKEQNKPLLLEFYAKWCQSCNYIDQHVFANDDIATMMRNFILLRVDLTTDNPETIAIAKKFDVTSPPAIIFFDKNGMELDLRLFGDIKVESLSQALQEVTERE